MNIVEKRPSVQEETRIDIVDCDIHPALSQVTSELYPFLAQRWRDEMELIGPRVGQPFLRAVPYPRLTPGNGMRGDSWPANGGPPGSDLGLMREQLLDAYGISTGILMPITASVFNLD